MLQENLQASPRIRPEISPKFFSKLDPNQARTRPEKPGLIYNSAATLKKRQRQIFCWPKHHFQNLLLFCVITRQINLRSRLNT